MASVFDVYGNPSSHHSFGKKSNQLIKSARADVAELIGADPDEVYFTSGGSESNNLVLRGAGCTCPAGSGGHCSAGGRRHVITTKIEHPSVLSTCRCLFQEGYDVTFLDVNDKGRVSVDQVEGELRSDTLLVSVMFANNEIGTVEPIEEIAAITRKRGVLFHTDAVQAVGKIPIDVKKIGVDFLSLSGHKLNGPKGIGALYIHRDIQVCPIITGGHQEKGLRAGTENLIGIVGLAAAARMAKIELDEETRRISGLRDRLERGILELIPHCQVNGDPLNRLPNVSNVSFKFIEGEAILYRLDYQGIAVSTGSACSSGSLNPSHVLLALGLSHEMAHGSIRMSLGRENTEEDVDYVLSVFPGVIKSLRALSPFS
jgi:cysteine desulfurase